jgi:hypothetical protein
MNGLRALRNRMIHDSLELSNIAGHHGFISQRQYVLELKVFVDELLYAFIANGPKLQKRSDFCQLLDDCNLGQVFSERYRTSQFRAYVAEAANLANIGPAQKAPNRAS